MKFQSSELPLWKPQTRRRIPKYAPVIALAILFTIPLYYPTFKDTSKNLEETNQSFDELPIITTSAHVDDVADHVDDHVADHVNDNVDDHVDDHVADHVDDNVDDHVDHPPPSPPPPPLNTVVRRHEKGKRRRQEKNHHHHAAVISTKTLENKKNIDLQGKSDDNRNDTSNNRILIREKVLDEDKCDLFTGEWIPNPQGPYYTNATCDAIQEHQNCLKFGKPDKGFLKWRWKPDDCDLDIFDPDQFFELVRGKSIAFIGDSVARNHMQSLICLLSRVANPVDLSGPFDQNKRYEYSEHDFNISMFWAPYLVKTAKMDPNDDKKPFKLYLDEFDEHWTSKIASFDYLIISAGHWFFRPTYFYINNLLSGCLYCPESNITHLTSFFSYRRAFRTAFRAINEAVGYNGVTFLRTFAPSHFEGAQWDKGGDCVRTGPFKRNETALVDYSLEMYLIQLEELRIAQKVGRKRNGGKFKLFDATKSMLLRPDGHPSKYGHWPNPNQTFANDCVHWCLPGPIDSWNDFLQELLRREIGEDSDTR